MIAQSLPNLQVSGSRLDTLRMAHVEMEGARFTDVVMAGCDLTNAGIQRGTWTRVECSDSKLTGVRANESS